MIRPPNLSVKMPSGMLTAAAKNGSIAAKISTWVALKSYHLIKKGASAENMPHTAKPSANARDDINKTLALPGGSAIGSATATGFSTSSSNDRAQEAVATGADVATGPRGRSTSQPCQPLRTA